MMKLDQYITSDYTGPIIISEVVQVFITPNLSDMMVSQHQENADLNNITM